MIHDNPEASIHEYRAAVVKQYLELPDTPSRAGPQDRKSAADLHARGISLVVIESALLLASLRRLGRPPDMPQLLPIRSLAYFLPVIQEIIDHPLPDGYLEYLRNKVQLLESKRRDLKCH